MSEITRQILPVRDAIRRWCEAAGYAGAMLPSSLLDRLRQLPWDAYWSDPQVGQADVFTAVQAAAADTYTLNDGHFPCPRGCLMTVYPGGEVALIWKSDTHTLTLEVLGGHRGRNQEDMGVLICEAVAVDSPRLRICRGT